MKRNFKRTISLILSVLMIVAVVPFSGMAACAHPNMSIIQVEDELSHIYMCTKCGYTLTEECESSTTGEASCENPKYCDVCDREISIGVHTFDKTYETPATLVDENVPCNQYNKYYKSCACSAVSNKETDIFTSTTNKGTNHDFTVESNEYVAKADCTKNPSYYYACSRCNVSSKGFTNTTYTDEDVVVPHNFEIPDEPVANSGKSPATCTTPALFYMVCTNANCGVLAKGIDEEKVYSIDDKTKDHEFINYEHKDYLIKPADCMDGSLYSKSCKVCKAPAVKEMEDDDFDPLGDIDVTLGDNGNAFRADDALGHETYISTEYKAPTCTAEGNEQEVKCKRCNEVISGGGKIAALKHSYDKSLGNDANLEIVEPYVAPTCKKDGSLGKGKCTREGCGQEVAINAKGETLSLSNVSSFVVKAPGHTDENKDDECDVCHAVLEPADTCSCICHADGGFLYFVGWILKWLWSLTGKNPYCQCGIAHYEVD